MLNTSKLLAIAIAAITALAFAPSVTFAQTVELQQEDLGHCPADVGEVNHRPTNTQCSFHAITAPGTTLDLYQHASGVGELLFNQCELEFEAAFDETGGGIIYDQILVESPGCGREPCDEAEGNPNPHRNYVWPAQISEVTASTTEEERLTVTFCLYAHNSDPASEGPSGGFACTVQLHVERIGHEYLIATPPDVNGNGGAPCGQVPHIEWEGSWVATVNAQHPNPIEIHHVDDP